MRGRAFEMRISGTGAGGRDWAARCNSAMAAAPLAGGNALRRPASTQTAHGVSRSGMTEAQTEQRSASRLRPSLAAASSSATRKQLEQLAKHLAPFGPLLYHGKIPHVQRQPILDRFKTDPTKHVVLMSGSHVPCPECAGIGEIHCCDGLREQGDCAIRPPLLDPACDPLRRPDRVAAGGTPCSAS